MKIDVRQYKNVVLLDHPLLKHKINSILFKIDSRKINIDLFCMF